MNIDSLKPHAMESIRLAADWLVGHQCREKFDANFGRFPFCLAPDGKGWGANNWNLAFGAMAMFAAEEALRFSAPAGSDDSTAAPATRTKLSLTNCLLSMIYKL